MSKKEEALAHIAKAEKSLKPSFWSSKLDYDSAIQEYSQAAICYRNARMNLEAADVYVKIAELCKTQKSLFNEAKNLEQAALLLKDSNQFDRVYSLMKQAANNLRLNGTPDSASILLEKGAKILEAPLPEKAADLYLMSAEACELESKWHQAADACGQAARMFVRVGKHLAAVAALEKKIIYCAQESQADVAGRAVTATVLIQLFLDDIVAARRTYDHACNSATDFGRSDDVNDVYQLICAYETYDSDKAKQLLTSPTFRCLENDFVKLSRSIKFPSLSGDAGLTKPAADANGAAPMSLGDEVEEEGFL